MRQSILAAWLVFTVVVSGLACYRIIQPDLSEAPHSEQPKRGRVVFIDGDDETKLWACVRESGELTCFEFVGFLKYVNERAGAQDAGVSL